MYRWEQLVGFYVSNEGWRVSAPYHHRKFYNTETKPIKNESIVCFEAVAGAKVQRASWLCGNYMTDGEANHTIQTKHEGLYHTYVDILTLHNIFLRVSTWNRWCVPVCTEIFRKTKVVWTGFLFIKEERHAVKASMLFSSLKPLRLQNWNC